MALTAGFKNLTESIITRTVEWKKDSTPYDMLEQINMGSWVEFVLKIGDYEALIGEKAEIIHTERDSAGRPISRTASLLHRQEEVVLTYHNVMAVRPVRTPDISNIDAFNRRINALAEVIEERKRQINNYGEEQIMHPSQLLIYLMSEVGEVADAYKRGQVEQYRKELVQVVALALAGLESYDLDLYLYEQAEGELSYDEPRDPDDGTSDAVAGS